MLRVASRCKSGNAYRNRGQYRRPCKRLGSVFEMDIGASDPKRAFDLLDRHTYLQATLRSCVSRKPRPRQTLLDSTKRIVSTPLGKIAAIILLHCSYDSRNNSPCKENPKVNLPQLMRPSCIRPIDPMLLQTTTTVRLLLNLVSRATPGRHSTTMQTRMRTFASVPTILAMSHNYWRVKISCWAAGINRAVDVGRSFRPLDPRRFRFGFEARPQPSLEACRAVRSPRARFVKPTAAPPRSPRLIQSLLFTLYPCTDATCLFASRPWTKCG